jgi:hypothetical protein
MDSIVSVIMQAGRTGIELALYVLLPIMVVMLALMKLLEARGVLAWVANALAPVLRIFGLPGLGIFAMVKLLLVSFSAPVATLALMDRNGTSLRHIAATLAMVLTMRTHSPITSGDAARGPGAFGHDPDPAHIRRRPPTAAGDVAPNADAGAREPEAHVPRRGGARGYEARTKAKQRTR